MNIIPDISVVMAVYNEEKYIKGAIDSILSQSLVNFELIIVDDGSSDSTISIIKKFKDSRIKLFCINHGGLPSALNFGINEASAEYIARMDGDDVAKKSRLEGHFQYLNNNKNVVAVGGAVQVIDKDGNFLYNQKMPLTDAELRLKLPNIQMFHSAITFRKSSFFKCGGYDKNLQTAQDKLLFNKMATLGELANIKDRVINYRIHPNAISRRSKKDNEILSKSINNIIKGYKDVNEDYAIVNKIYRKYKKLRNKKNSLYFQTIGKIYIEKNFNRLLAFKNLLKSILFNPLSLASWYNLLLLFLPVHIINKIKK